MLLEEALEVAHRWGYSAEAADAERALQALDLAGSPA